MQCYGCGKYGHWRPDCPDKEQSSSSRESRPPFAAGRGRGRPSFKGGDSRLPSKFNYLSIASDDPEADSTDETWNEYADYLKPQGYESNILYTQEDSDSDSFDNTVNGSDEEITQLTEIAHMGVIPSEEC